MVDARRHGVEGEVHGVAQEPPGADEDDDDDGEADERVEPVPARDRDDERRHDDAHRDAGIGQHVEEGAPDVEVALAAPHEEERRAEIDGDAHGGDPDDGAGGDRLGQDQALDRLDQDGAERDEQDDGVGERGQDRAALEAVRAPRRGQAPPQPDGAPGEGEAQNVAQIVAGVSHQRHRAREQAEDHLGRDVGEVEADAYREGEVVALRRAAHGRGGARGHVRGHPAMGGMLVGQGPLLGRRRPAPGGVRSPEQDREAAAGSSTGQPPRRRRLAR